jgi:TolB protein
LPTIPLLTPSPAPTATKPPAAPQGRLAFTVCRETCDRPEDHFVWIMNADGSGAKKLLDRASEPTFSPDGTKIAYYQWRDGIFVANADGTSPKKILGEANAGFMSWSHAGNWIAFSVRPGGSGNVSTDAIAPDGTGRRPIVVGWSPSWSPDDTQIVFQTCRGVGCGIYRAPSAGGEAVPIITDDGGLAAWSPDGKRIVYQKDVDGVKQLFMINVDGSGKKQLTQGASLHVSANWSLDGNYIFYRSPEGGSWAIWRMNADGSNPVKLVTDMPPGDWPYDRIAVTK